MRRCTSCSPPLRLVRSSCWCGASDSVRGERWRCCTYKVADSDLRGSAAQEDVDTALPWATMGAPALFDEGGIRTGSARQPHQNQPGTAAPWAGDAYLGGGNAGGGAWAQHHAGGALGRPGLTLSGLLNALDGVSAQVRTLKRTMQIYCVVRSCSMLTPAHASTRRSRGFCSSRRTIRRSFHRHW